MIKKIVVYNKILKIECNKPELNKRLDEISTGYNDTRDNKVYSTLTINSDHFIIENRNSVRKYKVSITERDIYQLYFYFVYSSMVSSKNIMLHSVVVKKENRSFMIVGWFGAGKTKLSLEFQKLGYDIISADHTLVEVDKNRIMFLHGTKRVMYEGKKFYLTDSASQNLVIESIIWVVGAANNGEVKITSQDDSLLKYKNLWNSFTWPYFTPMSNGVPFLKNSIRSVNYKTIKKFSDCVTPLFYVRGDLGKISSIFDRREYEHFKKNGI